MKERDLDDLAADLAARLPGRVERGVAIADLTTYRLGGPAAVCIRVGDGAALAAVAAVVGSRQPPVLVVGRGSNLLVADHGFAGLAIVLTGEFERIDIPAPGDDGPASGLSTVRGGGAGPLPVLARRAAGAGLTGLEFFVGIPGSVGGAVKMNAGGHGRETADVLVGASIVDLDTGEERVLAPRDLAFGYRSSALGPLDVVTSAEFAVRVAPVAQCESALAEIVRWRREHQPGGSNAGSVFANPPGDSAGRLIDSLGLKGLRVGGVVVSAKHANFFQAEAGATAADVERLVAEVRRRVRDETGVDLVPELRMLGFDEEGGSERESGR